MTTPTAPTNRFRFRPLLTGLLLTALWAVVLDAMESVLVAGPWQPALLLVFAVTVLSASVVAAVRPPGHGNSATVVGAGAGAVTWVVLTVVAGRAGDWLTRPGETVDDLLQTLRSTATPFDPAGPVTDLLLVTALLVATAVASASVGVGVPFAAGGLLSLLLVFPPAVTGVPADRPALLAAGVLLVLLAWVAAPRFTASGVVVAALAAVVTVTVVSAMPAARDRAWNPSVVKPPVGRSVPDVTVELARDIRAGSNTRVFSYFTGQAGTDYFPLAGLADFDGGRWTPADASDPAGTTVDAPWPGASAPTEPRRVTVDIDGLRSEWLPLPEGAAQVSEGDPVGGGEVDWSGAGEGGATTFDPGAWGWMAESATARADRTVTRDGDRYTVEVGGATSGPVRELADRDRYLALPGAVPDRVSGTARQVTGGVRDAATVGRSLADWFRGGEFVYDLSASYRSPAESGDPYEVAETLLAQRRGFCVHYASTFAVMARSLGVPARLMVGYAGRSGAEGITQVPAKALHAWPQLWVEGTGWVSFEPTPGGPSGAEPDVQVQFVPEDGSEPPVEPSTEPSATAEPEVPPAGGVSPEPSEGAAASPSDTPDEPDAPEDADEGAVSQEDSRGGVPVAVVAVAVVLVLLVAPALVRFLLGRWRRRAVTGGDRPAQAAWAEFTATAVDLGVLPRRGAGLRARTPEAVVEYLVGRVGAASAVDAVGGDAAGDSAPVVGEFAPAARALAAAVSAERYAGREVPVRRAELRGQLDVARAGLTGAVGGRGRVRAVVLPVSLLPGVVTGA